jgi:hypothetical protein
MKIDRLVLTITIGLAAGIAAQPAGNPLGAKSDWTVGVSAGTAKFQMSSEVGNFDRFLVRSSFNVTQRLDWFLTAGTVRLFLESNKSTVTRYAGKYRFAWGAGFKMTLKEEAEMKPGFWAAAQVLTYPSSGSFLEPLDLGGHWEYAMNYRFTEWTGCVGGTLPYRSLRFYLAGTGWGLGRTDNKETYYLSPLGVRSPSPLVKAEGKYGTGFWTGLIAGFEVKLPDGYAVTAEALYFNSADYVIMIGICQTGGTNW